MVLCNVREYLNSCIFMFIPHKYLFFRVEEGEEIELGLQRRIPTGN